MSQTYRKNKNSNDTTPAKIIISPDGTKIQITAGRKLQRIRSFASDPEITDAQFRALFCIVDRLNEGKEGTDESRWGSAYPNYDTLAKDIAKDERAARRIVKELEDGQRQTRSGGVTKLVPCKSVLNVRRSKDQDERDSVNEYRLNEWGAFAIDGSGKGAVTFNDEGVEAVTCTEGGGHLSGTGRSPVKKREVTAPNSSHLLPSETPLMYPPHGAPASGERGPADDDPDGRWFEMDTNPLGDKNLKNEFYELAEWWPDDFDGEACLALYSKLRRDGVDWNQMEETFGFVTGRNSPRPSLDKFLSDWGTYWDQSQSLEDEPDDADDQKPREREAAGGNISPKPSNASVNLPARLRAIRHFG
jgi:hypothetical protein